MTEMTAGFTMRIVDLNPFRVLYTLDAWKTQTTINSHVVGYPGQFADVPTLSAEKGGSELMSFTLYWPATGDTPDHWLGYNVDVTLRPDAPPTMPAGTKPMS